MSYCVNCGVKLDPSLDRCPLCNTPVLNPNDIPLDRPVSPFPKEKGQVEVVKRKDLAILLSVVLLATGGTCLLLNLLAFQNHFWSLYVIGACLVIWVMAIPAVIYTRMSMPLSLLLDGAAIALYQYLICFNTTDNRWFLQLGLPITVLVTALAILLTLLIRKVSHSFLAVALYIFSEIAVLCVGIELLIRHFLERDPALTWSALVLAICCVIVIALITIISRARLRNAVRRRLHF